jgi:hypothetical protein
MNRKREKFTIFIFSLFSFELCISAVKVEMGKVKKCRLDGASI